MAANATLRLILQNDIDPQEIGFLGFGTESSSDNAAGAVVILGMVNLALDALKMPRLSRSLEVPEFKHACLGGIYAIKNACRFVMTDVRSRKAIIVCGDIAQYERGSTGEQTQGAGTCAMLVEMDPRMFTMEIKQAGSSSAYRGPDFRKPFSRHLHHSFAPNTHRLADFPVFSGAYSQLAYLDAVSHAVEDMLSHIEVSAGHYYRDIVHSIFLHRPFQAMPITALAFMYVRGMARGKHHHDELHKLCEKSGVNYEDVVEESVVNVDLYYSIHKNQVVTDPYPATRECAKRLIKMEEFVELVKRKMSLGSSAACQMGNMYSAALPGWIAAAFYEAAELSLPINDKPMVAIGYGSGDAAEAIPIVPVSGWHVPASRIQMNTALSNALDLTREQYEALHDGTEGAPEIFPSKEFYISHVGERYESSFQDLGVEYYDYAL
eukprot:NODE_483_length_1698_cov_409.343845_g95_i1.p1 GENE.NODE_483_length_1698_cov_409.343845_g95_i1~~NODE_483_length_1698_cov_409.343845_g95_i1.p1  ORF type:complete len:508 (+),score=83.65 NODE_483_length_1698_cov_409.343845_g95_i1:218-1525(+)